MTCLVLFEFSNMNGTTWHAPVATCVPCSDTHDQIKTFLVSLSVAYICTAVLVFIGSAALQVWNEPDDNFYGVLVNATAAGFTLPILSIAWCVISTMCFILGFTRPELLVHFEDTNVRMRTSFAL